MQPIAGQLQNTVLILPLQTAASQKYKLLGNILGAAA